MIVEACKSYSPHSAHCSHTVGLNSHPHLAGRRIELLPPASGIGDGRLGVVRMEASCEAPMGQALVCGACTVVVPSRTPPHIQTLSLELLDLPKPEVGLC